jgi:hypothetical protein
MRKSTLIILAILFAGAVALTLMLDFAVQHVRPELENRKVLRRTFESELQAGSDVKLRYVPGGASYPVTAPSEFGLIVDATPSPARWTKDTAGMGLAWEMAEWAFKAYGQERPITWVLVRMRRSDETFVPHAFQRGENGQLKTIASPAPKRGG